MFTFKNYGTDCPSLLLFFDTVNVDNCMCINFQRFMKMSNFACIKIRVFSTNDSLGYNDSNFHSVYIFRGYL